MTTKFDEFVKQNTQSVTKQGETLSLDQEKTMWIEKLDQLYSLVKKSLSDYIDNGSIQLKLSNTTLTEELLGTYTVQEAHIAVGRQTVKLQPVGTFLVGARGRVDLKGPRGSTRLVVVPPNSREPKVRVSITSNGETPLAQAPIDPPETWVWKIATPPPRVTYIDLTIESFREALMGVVNG